MPAVGLDVGHKRIGVAVADGMGWTAQPHSTFYRKTLQGDVEGLCALLAQVGATQLVVGLPLNLRGEEGQQAEQTRAFAVQLAEQAGLPLEFMDERFTSRQAEQTLIAAGVSRQKRVGKVDCLAACLILQAYLDRAAKK